MDGWMDGWMDGSVYQNNVLSQQKDPTDTMPPRKFIDKYLK